MSLGQVLYILWRRAWIVALTFLFALLVAVGVLLFAPARYDALATATVDPGNNPVGGGGGSTSTEVGIAQGGLIELVKSHRIAVDVVKRLNLTASPRVQEEYRNSASFGRESIDDWMAASILNNVDAGFEFGTNVLAIKYKSSDPNSAAQLANAFLGSTIDGSIAMKAAAGDQTARWFSPQMDDMRRDLLASRAALEGFQARMNVVAPGAADSESEALAAVNQDLASNHTLLTALQTRLASGSTDLANDPSDPDLQMINSLKEKITSAQADLEVGKISLGANNPRMVSAAANIAAMRKQLADETEKVKEHLKERIAATQSQIASLEVAQAKAQKTVIAAQAQRDRLADLERDVAFKVDELNARERAAAQARLQSKLTFADIDVLDKAAAPISPAFPKPFAIIPPALAGGLALGMILALIAEATDRRIRIPADFRVATSAPLLGVIEASKRGRSLQSAQRPRLAPAS